MLHVISFMVLEDLKKKTAEHNQASNSYMARRRRQETNRDIQQLQIFAAGLRTHEQELTDLLVFRAEALDTISAKPWQIGDPIPSDSQGIQPLSLKEDIVDIPIDLRCPISYEALQDPVVAADGQTYSLRAISQWFSIRKSSPLTGLILPNTDLSPNNERANEANAWIQAEDLLTQGNVCGRPKRRRTAAAAAINLTFSNASSTFVRAIPKTLSLEYLYKVAFRGMRGRNANFVLTYNGIRLLPDQGTTVEASNIPDNTTVQILVFAEGQVSQIAVDTCLIKVYKDSNAMLFGFWTSRWNALTLRSLILKYCRVLARQGDSDRAARYQVWGDMKQGGDGWMVGSAFASDITVVELFRRVTATGSMGREPLLDAVSSHALASNSLPTLHTPIYKVWIHEIRKEKNTLSRLEVLKQMFEALVNRMLAYSYSAHLGLVTISSEARLTQALTHVIENFRSSVEGLDADGDTALWDGLSLAKGHIVDYASEYPSAKKRIICLTDGNDTNSAHGAADVYSQLRQHDIVLDSICIGDAHDRTIRAISHLLGSYCFHPKDMASALAICEMEPMLSLKERPDVHRDRFQRTDVQSQIYRALGASSYTSVSRDVFPPRKQHDRINDSFLELTSASARRSSSLSTSGRSNIRSTRLLSEMHSIAAEPNLQYDCYVSEVDMSFWKVVMKGVSHMRASLSKQTNPSLSPLRHRTLTKFFCRIWTCQRTTQLFRQRGASSRRCCIPISIATGGFATASLIATGLVTPVSPVFSTLSMDYSFRLITAILCKFYLSCCLADILANQITATQQ